MAITPPVLSARIVLATLLCGLCTAAQPPARIAMDYPPEGAIFPPEFPAPTFLFRDRAASASWVATITFGDGAAAIQVPVRGDRNKVGPIDPRCVSATNKPPQLTAEQAAARTWVPDAATWSEIRKHSVSQPVTISVAGYAQSGAASPLSRGQVTIRTSADPVGAPIFYRDVPLMPSETEKGVIKPLAASMVPLIAWRIRNVGETGSKVLMEGIHSCANCHSFSLDGKTMGMDVDGPHNDKGLYAIVPVKFNMSITSEEVVAWSTFRGKLGGKLRVGFMSQVSPDGGQVVTTINDPGVDQTEYQRRKNPNDLIYNYYVANFKDYRFLQVFYPTRGILAWYSREAGRLQPLSGADDPAFVHTNAVWSPDGKSLVFARATAQDAYPPGAKLAQFANDPSERQVRYDLYRIPFNDGRGGRAEPIAGASQNGMSNSFPKLSPDGRWLVYVQARNGQLMRPDGQLFIVPASGGTPRRMNCNTPLMNSWHSFSPNSRWMVFSSKSRSPYTQMYLTHIDENGVDSPAILIENSTAANRAVNIPEFVNIPPDGILKLDAPVTDYYRVVDTATDFEKKGQWDAAVREWQAAVKMGPDEAAARLNLGLALSQTGKDGEAVEQWRKALELSPEYPEAHNNLANALARNGKLAEAVEHYELALKYSPDYTEAHNNVGNALAQLGRVDEAIPHFRRVTADRPDLAEAHAALGLALFMTGKLPEAVREVERATQLAGPDQPVLLDLLGNLYAEAGRLPDALRVTRQALASATRQDNRELAASLSARIAGYESRLARPR